MLALYIFIFIYIHTSNNLYLHTSNNNVSEKIKNLGNGFLASLKMVIFLFCLTNVVEHLCALAL